MTTRNGNGNGQHTQTPLLDRLATLRDQARDFGDHELAFTLYDARQALLNGQGIIDVMRRQLVDALGRNAQNRRRIRDQVDIIRKLRATTDPAHNDPTPPAPWHS